MTETKRSDQIKALSDEWTEFVTSKRGEWIEKNATGNDAAQPSLERFLGEEIAMRILGVAPWGGK